MKAVFVCPSYWPYVRRGAERCIHDLASFLARRGHQVHIITSTPGRPRIAYDGSVRLTYVRQLSHPLLYQYNPLLRVHAFGIAATRVLIRERADVAHLHSYSGLSWASVLRRALGMPYLLQIIMLNHYWPGRLDRFVFPRIVRGADRVVALTRLGAQAVKAEFGVACDVLPPPVDMDTFQSCAPRDLVRPKVLFTGDLADPRKGGWLLLQAWNRVHRQCPEARLLLAGSFGLGAYHQRNPLSVVARLNTMETQARATVDLLGPGALGSLPLLYSQAAVTVLPSIEEAFGIVLTESLACGTPVVASAFGGPGEIVSNPAVGATVQLRDWADLQSASQADHLADAILQTIELARRPETPERCREWADQWSVARVGQQEETLLLEMIAAQKNGHIDKASGPLAALVR